MGYPLTRKVFDFFLFTSLFIAICAVVMIYQSYTLIVQRHINIYFTGFVFCSTVCSYNFHWFLTPFSATPSQRLLWDMKHRIYHLSLAVAGFTGALIFFVFLSEHWFYLCLAAFLTFLYTAPKISFPPFQWLKKIAIGKTIFLAFSWTYVTSFLPMLIEHADWSGRAYIFCSSQFFFICSICILFDYRDKEDDKADGIRSLVTLLNEKGINWFFGLCIIAYIILTLFLYKTGMTITQIIMLLVPALFVAALYKHAKRNFSDYLYYFVLDGLMMLSGLILWVVNRF